VIFNVAGAGFFRVTYDDDNWAAIADTLSEDPNSIGVVNRAQILSDALAVASEGSLSYDVALDQTEYLDLENEYVPWSAATSSLSYISLMLSRSDAAEDISNYISEKISHVYDDLGYDEDEEEDTFKVGLDSLRHYTLVLLRTFCFAHWPFPSCVALTSKSAWTGRRRTLPNGGRPETTTLSPRSNPSPTALPSGEVKFCTRETMLDSKETAIEAIGTSCWKLSKGRPTPTRGAIS